MVHSKIRHTFGLPSPHFVRSILGITFGGGNHSAESDPFLSVLLAPPGKIEQSVIRSVPIGEAIGLYSGALLEDEVVVGDHLLKAIELDLVFCPTDRIVPRSDIPGLPLAWADTRQQTAFLEARTGNGDVAYIAMAEIFRFYYFTSSVLGRTLLSAAVLEPQQTIYMPTHTSMPADVSHPTLVIRSGMTPVDVPTIACMVLPVGQLGLMRIRDTYLNTLHRVRGIAPLVARPPFDGPTHLKCRGVAFKHLSGTIRLITKLDSCSSPMPFTSLKWRYEDDYKPAEWNGEEQDAKREGKSGSRKVGAEELEFVYLDAGELPSTAFFTTSANVESLEDRFPALRSLEIARERLEPSGGAKTRTRRRPLGDPLNLSASRPSSAARHSEQTQAVNPTTERAAETSVETEDEVEVRKRGVRFDVLHRSLRIVRSMATQSSAEAGDRVVSDGRATILDHVFNLVPSTVNERVRRWLYLDEERTKRRPVLIVEFRLCTSYAYFVDMVRRDNETMCLMLFTTSNRKRASDEQIRALLSATASARVRGSQTSVRHMLAKGLVLYHEPHRPKGEVDVLAAKFCRLVEML